MWSHDSHRPRSQILNTVLPMLLPLSCTLLEMIPLSCDLLHTSQGRGTALTGAAPTLLFIATRPHTYEYFTINAVMSICAVGS